MYNLIDFHVETGIATVTFCDSETGNEWTAALAQELSTVAQELMKLRDVKVVIVCSALTNFSVGMTKEGARLEQVDPSYHTIQLASEAMQKWAALPYPIIAAIQGQCHSLAFSFVTLADIRIVSSDVEFKVPEISWGLVPAGGISQRLPRIVGKGPAMAILLGAKSILADEALALGLTTKVVKPEELIDVTMTEAKQLSELSTLSLQYTKECLLRGSELPFNQGLRLELDVYMTLQTSEDRMEGIEAFLQKRTPHFIGE